MRISNELLIELLMIFILALIGSCTKDYYNMLKDERRKISISRIFVSAISATFFVFGFLSDYLIKTYDVKGLMSASFFFGLIGFKLIEKFSNVGELIRFILGIGGKK